jgi:NitT/TauT family transport system ATP-binding protein
MNASEGNSPSSSSSPDAPKPKHSVPRPIQADALQPEIKAALKKEHAETIAAPPQPAASASAGEAPSTEASALPIVVSFRNVTKSFGDGPEAKVAVQDVSFEVEDLPGKGELVCLVGPSGCGKSTVLRLIAGLTPHFPPTSGEIRVFGKELLTAGADRGLVDQKYSLLPHLTVVENIAFGLRLRGVARKERRALACEWVKKVGLEGAEDKYPSELSGGMQQRVAIAATLILKPRILLMDEPFGALDPRIRLKMQELLLQLWKEQEGTVFFVTHSVEEAVYLGDRVFRMAAKPGRLVEILHVERSDEPLESMRQKTWFSELTADLLQRLEMDALASGALRGSRRVPHLHAR